MYKSPLKKYICIRFSAISSRILDPYQAKTEYFQFLQTCHSSDAMSYNRRIKTFFFQPLLFVNVHFHTILL